MRYLFILIPVLIILFLFSYKSEEDDIIVWNKNRPLIWNDYKGKPQRRFAAASTVYSLQRYIEQETKESATVYVKAYFYCKDSWKKDNWINDDVLKHEQKHFDIVELYARKLRKQVSEMVFLNYKQANRKVDSLYYIINNEMDVYQDKYDDETDGSMNGEGQTKWEKKIMKEIEELNKFESTAVQIKLTP